VRDYELGIVVSPEASEEQTKAILDRVTQVVQAGGGQVVKVHPWGRRRLAYPIERHRDGLYFFLDLSLTPQTVFEIDRNLKVNEEVIRHLIVKRDPRVVAAQRAREAQAAATEPAQAPEETQAEAEAPAAEAEAPEAEVVVEVDEPGEVGEAEEAGEADEADELDGAPAAIEEAEGEA
jgi:small subunit ribosomal protein S6